MRLRSVPARFGVAAALRLAALCHLGMVVLLLRCRWCTMDSAPIYLAGVAAIGLLLGLRALAGPARRPEPREPGVLPRQRRGEHRIVGGGVLDLVLLSQSRRVQ